MIPAPNASPRRRRSRCANAPCISRSKRRPIPGRRSKIQLRKKTERSDARVHTSTQQAQKQTIADLEARQKEAARVDRVPCRIKLDGVENDRDSVSNTLRVRESALQKELNEKQQTWCQRRWKVDPARTAGTCGKRRRPPHFPRVRPRLPRLEKQKAAAEKQILFLKEKASDARQRPRQPDAQLQRQGKPAAPATR